MDRNSKQRKERNKYIDVVKEEQGKKLKAKRRLRQDIKKRREEM